MCNLYGGTGRIVILHLWGDNYLWRICPCMENDNKQMYGGFERNEHRMMHNPPKCENCGHKREWAYER